MNKALIITTGRSSSLEERVEACKKAFPWVVSLHPHTFESRNTADDFPSKKTYHCRLFQFAPGTSRRAAAYGIRRHRGWEPAAPIHMLAFATDHFAEIQGDWGERVWHHYIVGLGGDLQTVLGSQFGGLNEGTAHFFDYVSCREWKHAGGPAHKFLGVREVRR